MVFWGCRFVSCHLVMLTCTCHASFCSLLHYGRMAHDRYGTLPPICKPHRCRAAACLLMSPPTGCVRVAFSVTETYLWSFRPLTSLFLPAFLC